MFSLVVLCFWWFLWLTFFDYRMLAFLRVLCPCNVGFLMVSSVSCGFHE